MGLEVCMLLPTAVTCDNAETRDGHDRDRGCG